MLLKHIKQRNAIDSRRFILRYYYILSLIQLYEPISRRVTPVPISSTTFFSLSLPRVNFATLTFGSRPLSISLLIQKSLRTFLRRSTFSSFPRRTIATFVCDFRSVHKARRKLKSPAEILRPHKSWPQLEGRGKTVSRFMAQERRPNPEQQEVAEGEQIFK